MSFLLQYYINIIVVSLLLQQSKEKRDATLYLIFFASKGDNEL